MPKTKKQYLLPAELTPLRFGGTRAMSRAVDISPGCISRWKTRSQGYIPNRMMGNGYTTHQWLLKRAKELGFKLTASEVIEGGYE